ncbi:MAG: hypothetical protein ACK4OE_01775 [Acidovorax sp.]|uniref:hypothetical protein n=1 Tax=Acidovorax sp. TaxID=1872122 RepID=UPI0039189D2B
MTSGKFHPRKKSATTSGNSQPLLRALAEEATKRGDSLAMLAKSLGVTYVRLAQWRRNDADIGAANRSVHKKAANYLGIPPAFVPLLAGTMGLEDFVWPAKESLDARISRELKQMRQDSYVGAFVPETLESSSQEVKLFVAFLYRELTIETMPSQRINHLISEFQKMAQNQVVTRTSSAQTYSTAHDEGLF